MYPQQTPTPVTHKTNHSKFSKCSGLARGGKKGSLSPNHLLGNPGENVEAAEKPMGGRGHP